VLESRVASESMVKSQSTRSLRTDDDLVVESIVDLMMLTAISASLQISMHSVLIIHVKSRVSLTLEEEKPLSRNLSQ
jgi:hypothetical protein